MYILRILTICLAIAVFGAGSGQEVSAQTPVAYDTQEIRETQCYRHILEFDDILCLSRYALVDNSDTLSINGAFLRLQNATSTVTTGFVPIEDYGIKGNYFATSDPSIPTWNDTTLEALFIPNPFVAPSGASSTPVAVEWNITDTAGGTFDETLNELVLDIPRMLQRLEEDSPDLEKEDLVLGTAITPTGAFFLEQAYEPLTTLLSPILVLEGEFAGPDHVPPPAPAFVDVKETEGRDSRFTRDWSAMWSLFGVPFNGAMLLAIIIPIAFMFLVIHLFDGDKRAGLFFVWPFVLAGSYFGGFPFAATVLIPPGLFVAGAGLFIKRFIPTGG